MQGKDTERKGQEEGNERRVKRKVRKEGVNKRAIWYGIRKRHKRGEKQKESEGEC